MRFDRDQVRNGADIAKIIGSRVKLRREGKELKGLCPFHKETTPSFTVSNSLFNCFGCGAGGDVFEFIRRAENLSSFPKQLKRVAELAGVPPISNGASSSSATLPVPRIVETHRELSGIPVDTPQPRRTLRAPVPPTEPIYAPRGPMVAAYSYLDEQGNCLF